MNALVDPIPTCNHPHVDIRAFECSNGTIQYVKQCLKCGEKVGNPIKKEAVVQARGPLEFILPFDHEAREQARQLAWKRRQQEMEAARAERMAELDRERAEREAERAERRDWYHGEYLNSPEWKRKRAKVMQRAGGVCEGCMEARATDVHHLTYDHVGDELLFELVALCRSCHDRAHGRDRQQEASA